MSDIVAGYRLYYGTAPGNYTKVIDVGNATTCTVSNLIEGTNYYFAVAAYNLVRLQSDLSPELRHTYNLPPTLDPLLDREVNANEGLQTVQLTGITAGASKTQPVIVTARSSDPELISNPIVNHSNRATTGALTFRPRTNAFGTATITVSVSDGLATIERSFAVNLSPVFFKITSVTKEPGGGIKVAWQSVPGSAYRVLSRSQPGGSAWLNRSGHLTATTTNTSWTDYTVGREQHRFYVVEMLPTAAFDASFKLLSITPAAKTGVTLTWRSKPGQAYRVLFKGILSQPDWTVRSGIITADSTATSWTDTGTSRGGTGFYIVEALPGE